MDIDLNTEPLGKDAQGNDVYLKDIWPTNQEINDTITRSVDPEQFTARYGKVFEGDEEWQQISGGQSDLYSWDPDSTYIQEPSFFMDMTPEPQPIGSIDKARCLVMVSDSVTTDHISPAGAIKADGPAGRYLQDKGVKPAEFNSFGSRRGNDRVMTRGTFANIRLRNLLVPGSEGGVSKYLPNDEEMSIFDAACKYKEDKTPLIVLAGKEYGTGSSRDWAAKGTYLLGIRAVIAESYERIHRSNLVGMGVLPLQFQADESRESLGLTGRETFNIQLDDSLEPQQDVNVTAIGEDGSQKQFTVTCRIDTPVEIEYYRNGGILHTVLRKMLHEK
jgi:aconitate hydratase